MRRGHLLDASALLALLFREPGAEEVVKLIDDCEVHAVNLAEVVRRLMKAGAAAEEVERVPGELGLEVLETVSAADAFAAGKLGFEARAQGLSTGDCVCLAVAERTERAVVTADRRWSEVAGVRVRVVQIR